MAWNRALGCGECLTEADLPVPGGHGRQRALDVRLAWLEYVPAEQASGATAAGGHQYPASH